MSVTYSQITSFNIKSEIDSLKAIFLYPKLVIFEGSYSYRIVDFTSKNEDSQNLNNVNILNQEIADQISIDHLLWLVLKNGEILIVNIQTCSQLKLIIDNYANYKIHRLRNIDGKLYLFSESGECLEAPLTTKELDEKFGEGVSDLTVKLAKVRLPRLNLEDYDKKFTNGINVFVDAGDICIECPITGLCQILDSNVKVEHIVSWNDAVILANKSNMWILDLKDASILYKFDKCQANYYPLASHGGGFYYLLWDKIQVQVYWAWNASSVAEEEYDIENSNKSISKSSQDTLKSQMQCLVDAAISNSSSPDQVLQQLKPLIAKIEDICFLLENAFKICEHNIEYKSVLHPIQKKTHETNNCTLIKELCDLMIKVDLMEYILFRGVNTYDAVDIFQQNHKQLCITFISNSDLDLASLCWLKYTQIVTKISAIDVMDILDAVPHNIKLGTLIIWLRNFLPSLLDENPYFIDLFVKWTTKRVFLLENSNYWPKIGLKFINEIVAVLEKSLKIITIRPISMDDLDILEDHINYIIELKEKYKVNMLLGEISSQSPNEVALIMLRRCYTEDLSAFLQDFLPAYTTRYLFELDDTLRSFIENEAATCGGVMDSTRLNTIIEAFHSPTNRLDCLLQVLKVLDVPWDDTVVNLAVKAAGSVCKDFTVTETDRLLAQEIQQELNYAKVKVVLKKYNFPLSCTDYTLVLHKIVNASMVNLNDLKVITSVMTKYMNFGSILYIDRCLRDCETLVALEYFNDRSNKEKKTLLKSITTKYEQIINGNTNYPAIERNYLDFLKGTKLLNDVQVNDLENMYHMKNSYNVSLSLNKLYDEKFCRNKTEDWIKSDGITASSGRGRSLIQLTRTHHSKSYELITLLRRTSTSNQIRTLIEQLLMSAFLEESLSGKYLATVLCQFRDGCNSSLLLQAFDVLVDLLLNCGEEHLHYLLKNLAVLNALINTNIVVKNLSITWKFHYLFLPLLSVNAANDLIDFYLNEVTPSNIETACVNVANKNDFITFRFISHLMEITALSEDIGEVALNMKQNAAGKLISKVIASQDIDELLLTNLLLILNAVNDSEDKFWILDTLQGQNDSLSPALMCYVSSPLIRHAFSLENILPANANSCPPQYILKSKFNINLAEMALPENTEETWDVKVVLFYVLRQYPDTTFERLVELCHTLNVSVNDGLSLHLISLLTTWELKYKVYSDELGCRHLKIENDEKSIISRCFTVWESIRDKNFLKDVLNDFWRNGEVTLHGRLISINPYYYEVYMCIYHLIHGSSIDTRNKKEYFLLNFLKEYRRKSTPKQYEFELFSVKGMFPEIGHYRLPFHLFMREDMWSNLKSEITLETYERWLPAVILLSLDSDLQTARDMICSNALKQTMTSRKRNEVNDEECKENEPWRLATREEPLLRAAHKCVRHIANMEWAGACLFYVLQGCARGADQVAAAQLCYQFAQRWAALQPGNRAVRQMERLHSTLSTRHALHKIEWACEDLVRLSAEPSQLIRAMYMHPAFIDKMSRYDVNRAANEIADKNGINISSIRIQILENILSRSKEESKNKNSCSLDTKKLMIAKYILKATCPKMGAIYLSRIAFDDESDFDKSKKLRALQCLMSVVEQDTAVKVTNRERDDLWSSLLELLYVVNLEDIDMPWLVATVTQDKTRAIEQLLQACVGNVEGLKLAAQLTRKYGNLQFIRQIIPSLLRAGLFEETIPLLLKISAPPDDLIYTAWRAVILSPFQRADYPITERQKSNCLTAINLLPICPIIKDNDLIEIWKNCVRCKCLGLGCLVLPYITPEKRQTLVEIKKIDRRNLIASLKNLQSDTYLVSGAMIALESFSNRQYK